MIYLLIPILIVCCVFFIPRARTAKDTPNQMEEHEHRRRRKKRIAMILFLLFLFLYVTFAILDAMVLKLSGYLGTWDAIGKREIVIGNLDYAVSPDRTEIVLNYDLVTKYYDSWAATTPDGRPVPSRSSSVPAETRIPLDPMPDELAKCFIQVEYDSGSFEGFGGRRVDNRYTGRLGNANGIQGEVLPLCTDLHLVGERNKIRFSRAFRDTLPDGLEYTLVLRPEDEPVLSGVFACQEKTSNAILLMIPYDRDGDLYVMLSAKRGGRDSGPLFIQQIEQEHPEVLTTTRDTGFLIWCKRILLVPLGFLCDMVRAFFVLLWTLLFWG